MSNYIVKVENLSKKYIIGENLGKQGSRTFRDIFDHKLRGIFSKKEREIKKKETTIWALKDVSFEIQEGDIVGIIGRNGAGKSTLLKILSRITEPTIGWIKLHGRVASLLEVGTGFNQELTGRENIYLNGSILGMRKIEIEKKFDEIVAFSELEKFLDTPVKRYSSGMYVRLAFAVAAHLEPDILIVDEVLAVGDMQFQKKCLGKMQDVSKNQGRTVFFVSHNIQAITNMCSRVIQLKSGQKVQDGETSAVVRNYTLADVSHDGSVYWQEEGQSNNDIIQLRYLKLIDSLGNNTNYFQSTSSIHVQFGFTLKRLDRALTVGFDVTTPEGIVIFRSYHNDLPLEQWPELKLGENILDCTLPSDFFNSGTYIINIRISLHNIKWLVYQDSALCFEVEFTHGKSEYLNNPDRKKNGIILPILDWKKV
jgi:lipopolysaccharide transport system ATP-binding protein